MGVVIKLYGPDLTNHYAPMTSVGCLSGCYIFTYRLAIISIISIYSWGARGALQQSYDLCEFRIWKLRTMGP